MGELADLGGVSRRTVRYYVQERLISPPSGLGRGAKYGREHLDQLVQVKALQERGLSLDEVRLAMRSATPESPLRVESLPRAVPRSHWVRVALIPGVELHVESGVKLPSPEKMDELAEWCRTHVRSKREEDK